MRHERSPPSWSRVCRFAVVREDEARVFDVIIVGGGSGNSILDERFDGLSVALIDDGEHFGGTCLNAGCIPTKMFVHVADVAADAREATPLGVDLSIDRVDWPRIRDRVFGRTDFVSESGLRYRSVKSPNVTVYRETFGFVGSHELVSASGVRIRGARIVAAAGSRPRPLPAHYEPGVGVHDSDSIMRIAELPDSLLIVGGGSVASEFAHVFSALGVAVTQVVRGARLLTALDGDVSERFTELAATRWSVVRGATVSSVDREDAGLRVELDTGALLHADAVLSAVGRIPNTDTLNAAGVGFDLHEDGRLRVDEHQRVLSGGLPVDGVFALGDVSSRWQLKHVANHQARVVQHNLAHPEALVGGNPGPVPHAIFSYPQIAFFGSTEADAVLAGEDVVVVTQEYAGTAWGWALEDITSFCKLVVDARTGRLLGAHILGPDASILLQPLLTAASQGVSIRGLARAQYWPHPAATEIVENALLKAEAALDDRKASAAQERTQGAHE